MPQRFKRKVAKPTPALDKISTKSETRNPQDRTALLNLFASKSEPARLEVFDQLVQLMIVEPQENLTADTIYSLLILAVKIGKKQADRLTQKRDVTPDEGNKIRANRVKSLLREKNKKTSPKANKIRRQFFHVIANLRDNESYSWSEVTDYLHKYHHFEATRSYVQQNFCAAKKEYEAMDREATNDI